ncbi:chemotaxis protein CheY [Candidatus Desulfofervidus auxilii]|uniref:Chemotaxis protein CheY n=1 Tax=Desulfofervidus auxilii TaxID=1621989 RepID=A0A7V1K5N6_DESA2|nr:response regulator [Candidatus Desulfofervidus auxilii]AMM41960.1 chemotaxis protein CheY [Candidatus Desulfofervidus auxilii]HEC50107.1 response regulator [Candidatus Desulfofervidus auxilii]
MKKILIVDDEERVRRLIETTLDIGDFQIFQAKDGEEALKIAQEEKPALILLDIMMPGMDGFEVCKRLKNNSETKGSYIIMLTAKGQKQDIEKGYAVGADDYFVKPFSPMELLNKIEKVLGESE